jgi:hypothetical protein
LVRAEIDRLIAGPVQVDLESRPVDHYGERHNIGEAVRVRIFFPQSDRLVEGQTSGNLRSEAVTGMNGGGHDRTGAVEHGERRVHSSAYPLEPPG